MPTRLTTTLLATLGLLCLLPAPGRACTNLLVTRGASADGSTMVTYAADSHELYGELYHWPAASHPAGATRRIIEWDTGKLLGEIPEARRTYEVVGNMNEHQLVIAETTFGGRKELNNPKGGIDYGSLIYIALQRARTAREAIAVMTGLVARHGYASSGESFSIADPKEVWLMEMIGKGPKEKGALWVARKVPDGAITAHANQARIRTFPLKDRRNTLYSADVISFARERGWFSGKDAEFSFADTYAPMTYRDLRVRQARVWAIYRKVAPGLKLKADFVTGEVERLPLWVKPERKLTVQDAMAMMRDHFEGTPLDMTRGVGAGPYGLPYRWRPLTWEMDGETYLNERAIATQQTGFSFVSQSRAWLPGPIGGILWFGVDDAASSVYVPMYAGIRAAPKAFAVGTADFNRFSWDSAFWVFNWVSNWVYSRYSEMIVDVQRVQRELEGSFIAAQPGVDKAALRLYKQAPELARDYLTERSHRLTARTMKRWRKLGEELLMKYLDGNVRDERGKVTHPGYPKAWYRRIVRQRGDHFRVRELPGKKKAKEQKKQRQ